jgi:putative cell wall-binding protein
MPSSRRGRPMTRMTAAAGRVVAVVAAVVSLAAAPGSERMATASTASTPRAATAPGPRISGGQGTLTRVGGSDRVATSILISQTAFPANLSATAVVLARGDDFADALAGSPLAAHFQGPLLLTPTDGLTPPLRSEIQRVLPVGRTIYLLGGVQAIAPGVATDLQALGFNPVRVAGVDRYDTAVKIANLLGDPPTLFEADGTNFPDGLSAGPAAALSHGAVLLTSGRLQAPETAAYITAHPTDVRYAIGGPAATADPKAQALVGADRYATSIAVARELFASPSLVDIASGADFADALSGGPVAGAQGAPMILVAPNGQLPGPVQSYFNRYSNTVLSALLFGGTSAVSTSVAKEIAQALVLVPSSS